MIIFIYLYIFIISRMPDICINSQIKTILYMVTIRVIYHSLSLYKDNKSLVIDL